MTYMLEEHIGKFCHVFIDDIIIYAKEIEDFVRAVEIVFRTLLDHNIRLNIKKCKFGIGEITYLGHIVDKNGIRIDPQRNQGIVDMAPPQDLKGIQRFLGMINQYRSYIPDYVIAISPIQNLARKSVPFIWTDKCQIAFEQIKLAILEASDNNFIDYDYELFLRTDASNLGIGGNLYQIIEDIHIDIVFIQKQFNDTQTKWKTIEQEAYAIYYCITHLEHFLLGHRFTVETDHRVLQYIKNSEVKKLVGWSLELQQFTFDIKHIPGKTNIIPDTLSRCFAILEPISEYTTDDAPEKIEKFHNALVGHQGISRTYELMKAQNYDWMYMHSDISKYITECPLCQKCRLGQGNVDAALHTSVITEPGTSWCMDTIGPLPSDLYGNVYIITACDGFTRWVELEPTKNANTDCFLTFLVKLIGRYGLPKFIRTDQGGQFDANLVEELLTLLTVIHQHSLAYRPQANGIVERMNAEVMRHLRILVNAIKSFDKWSTVLPWVMRIINSSYNSSIGTAPCRMMFGNNVHLQYGLIEDLVIQDKLVMSNEDYIQRLQTNFKNLVIASQMSQQQELDKRLKLSPEVPTKYEIGDFIFSSYPDRPVNKLTPKWRGPYMIIDTKSDGNVYSCQHMNTMQVVDFHVTTIKKCVGDMDEDTMSSLASLDTQEYEIEAIVSHKWQYRNDTKKRNRKRELKDFDFEVAWRGYPSTENLFLKYKDIKDTQALQDYLSVHSVTDI